MGTAHAPVCGKSGSFQEGWPLALTGRYSTAVLTWPLPEGFLGLCRIIHCLCFCPLSQKMCARVLPVVGIRGLSDHTLKTE